MLLLVAYTEPPGDWIGEGAKILFDPFGHLRARGPAIACAGFASQARLCAAVAVVVAAADAPGRLPGAGARTLGGPDLQRSCRGAVPAHSAERSRFGPVVAAAPGPGDTPVGVAPSARASGSVRRFAHRAAGRDCAPSPACAAQTRAEPEPESGALQPAAALSRPADAAHAPCPPRRL